MPIRIITPPDGIETTASPPSETHQFVIAGSDNRNTVNAYALSATPNLISTNYGILYRQDIRCTRTAYNQWSIEVPYAQGANETGEWTWDFDTTGGTVHITQAKEEVSRYPASTAPDQKGAIAVDGHEVKGTEIVIPAMKIHVQFRHPLGVITLARAKYLRSITGTVSSDAFLTFAPGEVLFLGARGSNGSDAEATVSYEFAVAENATGLTIGGIAGVAKKAWDVAWIRYRDTITTVSGDDNPTRVAEFVYVDRVYETTPMSTALGFG